MTNKWMLAAACAIAWPSAAHADDDDCFIERTDIEPDVVTATYDPFSARGGEELFLISAVAVRCDDNEGAFVSIDAPDPTQFDGRNIRLIGDSGDLLLARLSDRSGTRRGSSANLFRIGQTPRQLSLQIERGQIVPPGVYRASLIATVHGRDDDDEQRLARTEPFEVAVTVLPAVGLQPASGTLLFLGELSDNDRAFRAVQFDAYANMNYELSFSSEQSFRLQRREDSDGGIVYVPLLDGREVAAGEPQREFSVPGNSNRRRHRLDVTVPSVGPARAGVYRDYITVAIRPSFGD